MSEDYKKYIHLSRYAKWIPENKARENTWEDTATRYVDFFKARHKNYPRDEMLNALVSAEVMPSMRCAMTAGHALDRDNVAGYNCAYLPVDDPRAFDEAMYVLMCGTGVGFSVERQYVNRLPSIAEEFHNTDTNISVADSKIGWCKALRELLALLYTGQIPTWDVSKVRPAGAPLKTFGGRASGPEPLERLFQYAVHLFEGAKGRRLSSLECHKLMCKVADIVVVGGVRRSALISLSNPTDERIRSCKSGNWFDANPELALSNNSAAYTEKPDFQFFLKEWASLYESKSGERGIFSRPAAVKQAAKNGRRETDHEFGTNPCCEIILRPYQFCNLTEVVVRPDDTLQDLERKVRAATILGVYQSTLTNFRYLRKIWQKNTEEERLLGVSLTGIMDHQVLNGTKNYFHSGTVDAVRTLPEILNHLRGVAVDVATEYSKKLGIPCPTAVTCVKPSGTVSQLVDTASGIHPRYAEQYIRRVRADAKDPLTQLMKDEGVPWEAELGKEDSGVVFSFPCEAPKGAKTSDNMGAMEQLKLWQTYQEHWCEHKPSISVYYNDEEFLEIGAWIYSNFDAVSGISFFPKGDAEHTYAQPPLERVSKEVFKVLKKEFPKSIDWSRLGEYEEGEDTTTASHERACLGGACEL